MMKKEEKSYLYDLKEKEGKNKEQISLELKRDEEYQKELLKLKKKNKQEQKAPQNLNKRFKEEFARLK